MPNWPLVVRLARVEAAHVLEVRDQRAAERPEVHALIGERAEAEHHALAARHREIVGAEDTSRQARAACRSSRADRRAACSDVSLNCRLNTAISCGRKASFSSEPGTRSADTSKWLMALRPFWMNVLSPQLTHLPAEPQLRGHAAEVEARIGERIEQARVLCRPGPSRTPRAACARCPRPRSARRRAPEPRTNAPKLPRSSDSSVTALKARLKTPSR